MRRFLLSKIMLCFWGYAALAQTTGAPTTTTITSSQNPAIYGTSVTLTATVLTTGNIPVTVGTIRFPNFSGYLPLDSNGQASISIALGPGDTTIQANYDDPGTIGSPSLFAASFGTYTQDFQRVDSMSLSSSSDPSVFGTYVTFTASFTPDLTGLCPGGGVVTFYDQGSPIGTAAITQGQFANYYAPFSTSSLAIGMHSVTATFPGNSFCTPSSGTAISETILAGTTTGVVVTSNGGIFRNPTALQAIVSSGSGTPNAGTVDFTSGGRVLGAIPVDSNGHATLSTSQLNVGRNDVIASYSGGGFFAPSVSAPSTIYRSPKPH